MYDFLPDWLQPYFPTGEESGSDFLRMILKAVDLFLEGLEDFAYVVLQVLTAEIGDLIPPSLWGTPLEKILDAIGIGTLPLFSVMFGVGVLAFLVWQFVTWIANIVT